MDKKGFIILLYGTSTSGKTTICNNMQFFLKDLKIDGTDQAFKRLEEHTNEKLLQYIGENNYLFHDLNKIKKEFTDDEICNGILNEQINLKNAEIPLMFDWDETIFKDMLKKDYNAKTSERKAIILLRRIAKSYFDQLFILVNKQMFNLAIDNSIKGVSSILDIIPHPARSGQFMVDLFRNQFKKREYICQTYIVLIHCSVQHLSARMRDRNRYALAKNEPENIRDKPFPFRQYSQLFGASEKVTLLGN